MLGVMTDLIGDYKFYSIAFACFKYFVDEWIASK